MEIIIKDSEVVLFNLEDSTIRPTINTDSVITKMVIKDTEIDLVYSQDSKVE